MSTGGRHVVAGFLLAFLVALPAGAQPGAVRLPGYQGPLPFDSSAVVAVMPASAGAVFFATRQVLFELGIPAPVADSVGRYLINGRLIKSRSLAGLPLSTYLNCGLGLTGPNADSFRVTMAVAAFMDSTTPSTSRLRVTLFAGAQSTEGVAKSAVTCGSNGVLENRIIESVKARVKPQ